MAKTVTISIDGMKEKFAKFKVEVTKATVTILNPESGVSYDKEISVCGNVPRETDFLSLMFIERDKYCVIHTKDANGKKLDFIGIPSKIADMAHDTEEWEISYTDGMRYGRKVVKKDK